VPSLHVAYPLLIALEGFRGFAKLRRARFLVWPLRVVAALFFACMVGAAVYLDHHWIIDVVVGIGYALVAFTVFRTLSRFIAFDPSERAGLAP